MKRRSILQRCFGEGKAFYEAYHDFEWGIPREDDAYLFEMLSLEGAQAGLSWETILKKREGYREAFCFFYPEKVAGMTDAEVEGALFSGKIIKHRGKAMSIRDNARVFLRVQEEFGSFASYLKTFVPVWPIHGGWKTFQEVPCRSELGDALARDLKRRGMRFVGPKIIYSFMQAVGMLDDHPQDCPKGRAP